MNGIAKKSLLKTKRDTSKRYCDNDYTIIVEIQTDGCENSNFDKKKKKENRNRKNKKKFELVEHCYYLTRSLN